VQKNRLANFDNCVFYNNMCGCAALLWLNSSEAGPSVRCSMIKASVCMEFFFWRYSVLGNGHGYELPGSCQHAKSVMHAWA
jgi:hypothetical protein